MNNIHNETAHEPDTQRCFISLVIFLPLIYIPHQCVHKLHVWHPWHKHRHRLNTERCYCYQARWPMRKPMQPRCCHPTTCPAPHPSPLHSKEEEMKDASTNHFPQHGDFDRVLCSAAKHGKHNHLWFLRYHLLLRHALFLWRQGNNSHSDRTTQSYMLKSKSK